MSRAGTSTATPNRQSKSSVAIVSSATKHQTLDTDSASDHEPPVGPRSRKKRKVEVNGRAVAQHVTYTSAAKLKTMRVSPPTKIEDMESESESDVGPAEQAPVQPILPRPVFGPKSVQDKAMWKRQSIGSLQSPQNNAASSSKSLPPSRTPNAATSSKIKLKVPPASAKAQPSIVNKRKRESSLSEDDEKEEPSDTESGTAANSPRPSRFRPVMQR